MTQSRQDFSSTSVAPMEALKQDLFAIYYDCGRSVRYISDAGEDRPYWPNRYIQALKRAVEEGDAAVLALIGRLVFRGDPSRGFGILGDANRLDLTVEALVCSPNKPYHQLFDEDLVEAACEHLADHGYLERTRTPARTAGLAGAAIVPTAEGFAVDVRVEVSRDGRARLIAGEVTESVESALSALRIYTGLLTDTDTAARGGQRE